jgi:hypothetical protein
MMRILFCILAGALVGFGLGQVQSAVMTSGFEERFSGSRSALAESRGEKSREELLEQSQGRPIVEVVGGTEFVFGTMQHGATMKHDFVFRNVGDGPLNLDMGGSTCKCTVGELESSVLQPGEETVVNLTWTAQSIMPDYGQSATILTSDPEHPEVKIYVRGQIADSFVADPGSIALGSFSVSDEVDKTFHIFTYLEKSQGPTSFSWTNAKTRDLIEISFEKVDLDPEKFPNHTNALAVHEAHLRIKPGLPIGLLDARITFTTDQGDNVGTLSIPVSGRVTGDITLVGGASFDPELNLVNMGTVKSSEGAALGIWLVVQGEQRDEIEVEVASIDPADSLNVIVGEPKLSGVRRLFNLQFEVPRGAPETYYAGSNPKDFGKVVIKTNHKMIKEIPIHIRLNVVK